MNVPLTPTIKVYRDIDETDGCYVQFAIGHVFEKIAKFSDDCFCRLQLGSSIGWGNSAYSRSYFDINKGKFNDLLFSAYRISLFIASVRFSSESSLLAVALKRTVTS